MNYKGKLLEVLKELGMVESRLQLQDRRLGEQYFEYIASITFPNGTQVSARGDSARKKEAQQEACKQVLQKIQCDHPELLVDWTAIMVEAQVGDALLKLCAYRSRKLSTAEAGSRWLQRNETDQNMVRIFEQMRRKGRTDVAMFGSNVGDKRKASWVEALIARRFSHLILRDDADRGFDDLMDFMGS